MMKRIASLVIAAAALPACVTTATHFAALR